MNAANPPVPCVERLRVLLESRVCGRPAVVCVLLTALLFFGLAVGSNVPAADLLEIELAMDGSADPPGDRLDLVLFFMPGEKAIALEIRAFVTADKQGATLKPVKARRRQNRDADGRFLMRVRVSRPRVDAELGQKLVIPYADLDLPPGVYRIAYEVTGLRQGKVAFVETTRLTRLTVSDQPRRESYQRETVRRYVRDREKIVVFLPGERTRDGKSTVQKKQIEVIKKKPVLEVRTRRVPVNIPGGFHREKLPPAVEPVAKGETFKQRDARALRNRSWQPLSTLKNKRRRIVLFATNRNHLPSEPGVDQFGYEVAGTVTYGSALVNIPILHHKRGNLELPGWFTGRDPEKHFLVESLKILSQSGFSSRVGDHDVLLFVHGYATGFEAAVLRTAQLYYDLQFPGAPLAFSWPSAASTTKYKLDGQNAERSAGALAEVIKALTDERTVSDDRKDEPGKVHIIAHSMGNRVLVRALYHLHAKGDFKPGTAPLGQIILAAPDVGATEFNNLIPYVIESAEHVTYYYCNHDKALTASQAVNYYEPVGLYPFFERGIDTVNADLVDTSFLSHSYFSCSKRVLLDIRLIVNLSLAPSKRVPPLMLQSKMLGHEHWAFRPVGGQ